MMMAHLRGRRNVESGQVMLLRELSGVDRCDNGII